MYLAMNLFVLFMFADRVVAKFGSLKFVALYVSAVVVAFIPTTLRHMKNPRSIRWVLRAPSRR